MLRNPRVWLYAAGGWLILGGALHLARHVWAFVLEQGMVGQRAFAKGAMEQALANDPLLPSLWQLFRTFSVSFGLLLVLAGLVDVVLAWIQAPARVLRAIALLGTVFWTVAFVPYAFVDPVLHALVIALVAVPLHGIAFVTATNAADRERLG